LVKKELKSNFYKERNGGIILEKGTAMESDSSVEEPSRMSSCERTRLSFYVDDSWIKKLKFLKEKVSPFIRKSFNYFFFLS